MWLQPPATLMLNLTHHNREGAIKKQKQRYFVHMLIYLNCRPKEIHISYVVKASS